MLAAFSLLPMLFGIGLCFLPLLPENNKKSDDFRQRNTVDFATILLAGILCDFTLMLILGDYHHVNVSGALLALAGYSFSFSRKRSRLKHLFTWSRETACIFLILALVFLPLILTIPIHEWDARSIWFFHAKLIFYNKGMDSGIDWNAAAYGFSHVYYPKLVPAMAAQVARTAGFWNEYLPKFSLYILLLPALMVLLAHRRRTLELIFLGLVFTVTLTPWLHNGYMDGYLALYLAAALLTLGRWADKRDPHHWLTAWLVMGIMLNLKNEGTVLAALVIATMIFVESIRLRGRFPGASSERGLPGKWWAAPVVAFIPFVAWCIVRHHWNLENDMHFGKQFIQQITARVTNPDTLPILAKHLVFNAKAPTLLIFLVTGVLVCWRAARQHWQAVAIPALVAIGYFAFCVVVYLGTPHDLDWHLGTSYNRLELSIYAAILAAVFQLTSLPSSAAQD